MKTIFLIISLSIGVILFWGIDYSRAQDTTWRCTYGGSGYDEGRAVIQTFDGSR